MPLGLYTCNKQFTQEQRQMDQTYGIFESLTRSIEFTADNTFKFTYHYYYQSEIGYQLQKQTTYDASFSGTFVEGAQGLVATVLSGEYLGGDKVSGSTESVSAITGKIVFVWQEGNLKVQSVAFDNAWSNGAVIFQEQVFKKKAE